MLEGTFGLYIWRAATFGGKAYLCGRRKPGYEIGPRGEGSKNQSLMLESDDGLIWKKRAYFNETNGDETAFLFENDGSLLAIGEAVIEITEPTHTGCQKFSTRFGVDTLRMVGTPMGRQLRLRGVNARVVVPGTVRRGDSVTKTG